MIGKTLGHYRILEKLGAGGMGVVYRARDERLDRDVALKVLPAGALADEAARRRFRKEALALAKLNHSNIAAVYDFDKQNEVDFLVMEYVAGQSLAERLGTGSLGEKEIATLGGQIAAALEEAHEQGIIHRDLKPGNIVVTPKGQAKVLDFGLAKLLRPESAMSTTDQLSSSAAVAGTLPYMSPEQLRGKPADARGDIYAVGAVLYEMATGKRPFREEVATALVDDILHKPPPPPGRLKHDLSPRLEEIILKCLEKEPENRYQSAKELGVDLRRLAMPSSVATAPAMRAPSTWRKVAIRAAYGAAGLLVLVAMLVGINTGGWRERLLGRAASRRIESLAVLPLENLSGDPAQEYFTDGMTDELITNLAQISALKVISRTSAMRYKGTKKSLSEITRELHVDAVVEGSVMQVGGRVRITAQLIEAPTDRHLWARSYERDLRDVLTLQDELARAIAHEIRVALTPQEQARLGRPYSVDPQAHDAYLRGLYSFNRGRDTLATPQGQEALRRGIEQFQEAIRIDPNYAQAYAAMARAYHWLGWRAGGDLYPRSQEAARRALELDESLAEAHGALGYVALVTWNFAEAERELKRAIELNPNYDEAHHAYGLYLGAVGRFDEAVAEFQRARELDPFTLPLRENAAGAYACAHLYDLAIQEAQGLVQIDPNRASAHHLLGVIYLEQGRRADAIAEFQRGAQLSGNDSWYLADLAWAYAVSGRRDEALKIRDQLKAQSNGHQPPAIIMAGVYAVAGDKEQAFAMLEKAYQERDLGLTYLKCSSKLESLHSDPRYHDLLRRIGLPP